MDHRTARSRRLPVGYAIRLSTGEGFELYLPDPESQPMGNTTPCIGCALFVEKLTHARLIANVADLLTGQKWVPVLLPEPSENDVFAEAFATAFGEDVDDETSEFVRTAFGSFQMRQGGGR